MERDSYLYSIRRKVQVLAHKLLPDGFLSKVYFRIVLNKPLDLQNPKTFNEKIQWMKLYYYPNNPLVIKCTDKYAVRSFVSENGYGDKLVPLLGVWDSAKKIKWEQLPEQFVLKCTHGCAYNIIVTNKNEIKKSEVSKKLTRWLKEDFGAYNIELHYSAIQHHRIICEEYLGEKLTDYKFFCFDGEPNCFYVSNDLIHDRQAQIGFFYLNGEKMPLRRDDYSEITEISLPSFFQEMVTAARRLSQEFPFVRVDFFVSNDKWYFAELTFTPGAGMMPFNPDCYDLEWGNKIVLPEI